MLDFLIFINVIYFMEFIVLQHILNNLYWELALNSTKNIFIYIFIYFKITFIVIIILLTIVLIINSLIIKDLKKEKN